MRALAIVMLVCSTARAEDQAGYLGLGIGPAPVVGGELATTMSGYDALDSGRIRIGGRFERLGFEIDTAISALEGPAITGNDVLPKPGPRAASVLWAWNLVGYLRTAPTLQLAGRVGIGAAVLDTEDATHGGIGLELGVIAQTIPVNGLAIWADAGTQQLFYRIDERWVDGRIFQLVIGVGFHAGKSR